MAKKDKVEAVDEVPATTEAPVKLTPQEMATKRIAEKKALLEKLERDALASAKGASEKFLESKVAPVFVPFKDRDGKIVPALVLGVSIGEKRNEEGDLVLNEGREIVQEAKIHVWVFSHMSEPHRAIWTLPDGY